MSPLEVLLHTSSIKVQASLPLTKSALIETFERSKPALQNALLQLRFYKLGFSPSPQPGTSVVSLITSAHYGTSQSPLLAPSTINGSADVMGTGSGEHSLIHWVLRHLWFTSNRYDHVRRCRYTLLTLYRSLLEKLSKVLAFVAALCIQDCAAEFLIRRQMFVRIISEIFWRHLEAVEGYIF